MAYEIRPLATLAGQARQFFVQAVPGALVRLWANTFTVFGKVFALLDFEHEQRRKFLSDQLFASTAVSLWLKRHGFELGLTPDAGEMATGKINVPCAGMTAPVPEGTTFLRADGATYVTLAATPAPVVGGIPGAALDLVVQADLVGSGFNVDPGDSLQLVPRSGVPFQLGGTATVGPDGISGGTDAEDVETFRARVLYRKRNPPQGGSAPDYVEWIGAAVSTVKDVFVDSFANDSRSVWVCFTVTDQPNGIPSAGQIAAAQAYVSDPVRRPVTARVFVTAPTPVPLDIVLGNLNPLTQDVQAAIEAELAAMLVDEPVQATPSTPATLFEAQIEAAVKRAYGLKSFSLVSPRGDRTYAVGGQRPVLNSIGYQ